MSKTAPPMGVQPRDIWDRQQALDQHDAKLVRAVHLTEGILRYLKAKKSVPMAWSSELHGLICEDF